MEVHLLSKHFSKKQRYLLPNIKKSLETSILDVTTNAKHKAEVVTLLHMTSSQT